MFDAMGSTGPPVGICHPVWGGAIEPPPPRVALLPADPLRRKMTSSGGSSLAGRALQRCHGGFALYSLTGITLHDEPVDWAAAGDHVSLTLVGMDIIKIK